MTRPLAWFGLVWTFSAVSFTPSLAGDSPLHRATMAFQQAREELARNPRVEPRGFALAAQLFDEAQQQQLTLTSEQQAAWAYCKIRVAADKLNRSGTDPRTAGEVLHEAEAALQLAGNNVSLRKLSEELIQAAKQRGANAPPPTVSPLAEPTLKVVGRADGWEVLETESFRLRHVDHRTPAEALLRAAEKARFQLFHKWSGPPAGPWSIKCEIVLHPDANSFAQATKQPAAATGHAWLKLDNGQVSERRIDLRVDDATISDNALPRELTYIILGDLFWDQAPPKWAELGLAIQNCSVLEISRYRRSLGRCVQTGELIGVAELINLKEIPADRITGFYVSSVNLVDFLVKWKGERTFTSFLRDAARYGQAAGLQRHYGVTSLAQLQQAWLQGEK